MADVYIANSFEFGFQYNNKMDLSESKLVYFLTLIPGLLFGNDGWKNLISDKGFDDWIKRGGQAQYELIDGVIVGTAVANSPNTFLCTKDDYGDFVLEYEVWADPTLNAGVQIRSLSAPDYKDGRVHGYQVEVDPSSRAFSGGIYEEALRGWLYPLARNPKGQSAFRNGEWNSFHVEARGTSIRTWVNQIQCADLQDDFSASGFIGLQVHSVQTPEQVGAQVKYRNIRIRTEDLDKALWPSDPEVEQFNYVPNSLTEYEQRKGWRLLWDGKTTKGWRGAKLKDFPERGWSVANGALKVDKSGGAESAHGGDIVTVDKFSSFELLVDFKITEGANSGIKYFVDILLNKGGGSAIGLEYQILDDKVHPDAKEGVAGNRTVGSLYDLIAASNLSVPGRPKQFKGVGQWNRARIVVKGDQVEHWLNEEKVVEYERGSQTYRALVSKSKYTIWPDFGELPEGHILLQDHGDEVHFRNIKIREF